MPIAISIAGEKEAAVVVARQRKNEEPEPTRDWKERGKEGE